MKITFKQLTERQKIVVAGLGSVIVALILVASILWFTNPNVRSYLTGGSKEVAETNQKQIKINDDILSKFDAVTNRDILYTTVKIDDLPLYPDSWQQKYFSTSERQKPELSGPKSDADSDGLSNREEYFLGSHPRQPYTLCEVTNAAGCRDKNDGQNVAVKIHPLTGLFLSEPTSFKVAKQDLTILDEAEKNFDTASAEGVDFPSLFYLSKAINLQDEFKKVSIQTQPVSRESLISYQTFRVDTLQSLADQNLLKEFSSIYSIYDTKELAKLSANYEKLIVEMERYAVPATYGETHRANIFAYKKITQLIKHREQGLTNQTINSQEYKDVSKKLAVETVWAYVNLAQVQPG
jgi:hypothetical protein